MRKRNLPIMSYMPERDKAFRLQATTPYFQSGRIWVPKDKQGAEELIAEVISFNPKPGGGNTAAHDDYTDTVSQAILWMKDNFLLDNEGYSNRHEEDEAFGHKRRTYWSALLGR